MINIDFPMIKGGSWFFLSNFNSYMYFSKFKIQTSDWIQLWVSIGWDVKNVKAGIVNGKT